jgi:uncharacterized protein involved in exopolysaccharide biosynthesis
VSNVYEAPELEVDLVIYFRELFAHRYRILAAGLVLAVLAGLYSWQLPNRYEASARTALVDHADPGGVNPDERRAPEVLTLVEHGFVLGQSRDNQLQVTLAKLHSREFTLAFMDAHDIWTHLGIDDRGLGHKVFREQVRFIDHDEETDIIGIRFRWTDPVLVRDWANAYVDMFNNYMRERALEDVAAKQQFLEQELIQSQVLDIQQSIYRLMEAQTAIAMLANARAEFALEYIDPAVRPYDRFSPGRKKWVLMGGFGGAMLASCLVVALILLGRAKELLQGVSE